MSAADAVFCDCSYEANILLFIEKKKKVLAKLSFILCFFSLYRQKRKVDKFLMLTQNGLCLSPEVMCSVIFLNSLNAFIESVLGFLCTDS